MPDSPESATLAVTIIPVSHDKGVATPGHRCVGRTTAVRGSLVRALRVAAVVQLHRADEYGLGAELYRL